jgi:membrane-bound serine protease (ClpP class)
MDLAARIISKNRFNLSLFLAVFAVAAFSITGLARAQAPAPAALVVTFDGPVTPVLIEYIERGIREAEAQKAQVLIFQLNTPGGSLDLTLDAVEVMRASEIPIVVYVAPRGALAGSAGTIITLAGHLSAMAPETAIGAASPVDGQGGDIGETLETKLKEATRATIRSLMEGRPPEAVSLAEDTVENAVAVTFREAYDIGMIDFIAADLPDLLNMLDGQTVETTGGEKTLRTAGGEFTLLPLSPIEQFLQTLTNPNIVFLLLTVGVQAILIELGSPGGWVPGFIGVVALALATYGLGVLPVNWFGLVFLATSFVLFVLEVKAPTKGALTAAGITSFIIGSLVLFNSPSTPNFQRVSIPLVIGTSLVTAGMFAVVLTFAIRAQKRPIRTGQESLVGKRGIARTDLSPRGSVQVAGELWTAILPEGEAMISKGTRVEVVAVSGVHLQVRQL